MAAPKAPSQDTHQVFCGICWDQRFWLFLETAARQVPHEWDSPAPPSPYVGLRGTRVGHELSSGSGGCGSEALVTSAVWLGARPGNGGQLPDRSLPVSPWGSAGRDRGDSATGVGPAAQARMRVRAETRVHDEERQKPAHGNRAQVHTHETGTWQTVSCPEIVAAHDQRLNDRTLLSMLRKNHQWF